MRANAIKHETTTTGAGDLTLTTATGWPGFADIPGFTGTREVSYAIVDPSTGIAIEGGIGTVTISGLTFARTLPRFTWDGTTYDTTNPSPLSLASGTKEVICTPLADDFIGSLPFMSDYGDLDGATPFYAYASTTSYTLAHQRIEYVPILIVKPGFVDRVTVRCNGGAYTGGTQSLLASLHEVNAIGRPGKRLADFGNLGSFTVGNLTSGALGTPIYLSTGYYYMAFLAQYSGGSGGAPTLLAASGIITPTPLGVLITAGSGSRHATAGQVTGQTALNDPATLTSIAMVGSTSIIFMVFGP